jgi:cytochrome P450
MTGSGLRDFDPFSRAFVTDPYPLLAAMRGEAAVHHVRQPNNMERYLVVRHAEGRAVLTGQSFSANPEYGREALIRAGYLKPGANTGLTEASLLSTDPPEHTRLRRLLASSFKTGEMSGMEPIVERNVAELLGKFRPETVTRIDLVSQFAHPLTIRTLCEILGVEENAAADFTRWISEVMTPRHQPGSGAVRQAADRAIRDYLSALIQIKTHNDGGDDLTARLVSRWLEDPSQVSEAELTNMLYELILAGYMTTAGLIVNGVLALLGDPSQLELFRSDPPVRVNAVEELMRFDGPAFSSSMRFTTRDTEVAGTPIPAGALVSVSFAAANRDDLAFPDADRLDLTRENASAQVGFSHGIHLCWGAPIARMEARLAIGALLDGFRSIRLVTDHADVEWRAVGNSRSPVALPVVLGE